MCACVFLSSIKKNIAFLNINMIPTFLILVLRFCPDLFSKKKKKKKKEEGKEEVPPRLYAYIVYMLLNLNVHGCGLILPIPRYSLFLLIFAG